MNIVNGPALNLYFKYLRAIVLTHHYARDNVLREFRLHFRSNMPTFKGDPCLLQKD